MHTYIQIHTHEKWREIERGKQRHICIYGKREREREGERERECVCVQKFHYAIKQLRATYLDQLLSHNHQSVSLLPFVQQGIRPVLSLEPFGIVAFIKCILDIRGLIGVVSFNTVP